MRTISDLLKKHIGEELFGKVSKSPSAFAAVFDGELQPWDYQIEALEGAATLNPDDPGKFLHRWAAVSLPRQDGKSTLSAWYALWRFYTDETLELIISVALDRQSASIILNEARRIISGNEILAGLVDSNWGMTKWSIRLVDGAEWMIRPSEAQFSRGYRPGLICFDELGFSADDGELLQTLSAGQAAQARPQVFITSTVNLPTGPLWEIFERHRAGDLSVFCTTGNSISLRRLARNISMSSSSPCRRASSAGNTSTPGVPASTPSLTPKNWMWPCPARVLFYTNMMGAPTATWTYPGAKTKA